MMNDFKAGDHAYTSHLVVTEYIVEDFGGAFCFRELNVESFRNGETFKTKEEAIDSLGISKNNLFRQESDK